MSSTAVTPAPGRNNRRPRRPAAAKPKPRRARRPPQPAKTVVTVTQRPSGPSSAGRKVKISTPPMLLMPARARHLAYQQPLVQRLRTQFAQPELQQVALSVVLPEATTRGLLDQSRAGGSLMLECAKLQCSFNADVLALFTALAAANSRPEVNTTQGEGVPLYPSGSVPVIHFHDPACPFLVPALSPTAPAVGNPRSWRLTSAANPVEKIVPTSTTIFPLELVPRTLVQAYGGEPYKLPTDFRTRPIARTRTADAHVEYFWVDSCAATPTGLTCSVDISLACVTTLSTASVGIALRTIFLGADGSESENVLPVQSAVFTQNGATGKWEASINTSDSVSTSGWYRLAINLSFPVVQASTTYTSMTVFGRIQIDEFTRIGSGFFVDPTFASMTALSLRYWPSASSVLASFRSPPLTAAGSVFGVNMRPWKDWQEPLAMGDGAARAQAPVSEMANGQQGYDLRNGIYVWEKQSVSPNALLDTSVDLPYLPVTNLQERPPIAYLIGASGAFDGGSILYFDPSASQTGATVVMRFTSTTLYCYQPRSKAITPTTFPLILLPDQLNALQQALAMVPNFSENDWHDVFSRIAGAAFRVASYIVHAAGALSGNPLDAVTIFNDIQEDWKRLGPKKGGSAD